MRWNCHLKSLESVVQVQDELGGVRPLLLLTDERALDVDAQNFSPIFSAGSLPDVRQDVVVHWRRWGHQSRAKCSYPFFRYIEKRLVLISRIEITFKLPIYFSYKIIDYCNHSVNVDTLGLSIPNGFYSNKIFLIMKLSKNFFLSQTINMSEQYAKLYF